MRIAIMQPYLFPYLGYWQLMEAADIFVFYDDVQFMRRSYMTRNEILLEGKPFKFTLPTVKSERNSLINEILIDKNEYGHWNDKFLQTLYHAYSKAPYFKEAYPVIENIFKQFTPDLSQFLKSGSRQIIDYIGIDVKLASSSEIDYQKHGNAEEKIISICNYYKADAYINPIGGRHLYQASSFERNDLKLLFLQAELRPYPQFQLSFKSHLSIIDMMMFLSSENISERLQDYQLIYNEPKH